MTRSALIISALLLLLQGLPVAVGQLPDAHVERPVGVELTFDKTKVEATARQSGVIQMTIHDRSLDGPGGAGGPSAAVNPHQVSIQVTPQEDDPGWQVVANPNIIPSMYAGETELVNIEFKALVSARIPTYVAEVNVSLRAQNGDTAYQTAILQATNPGVPTFSALGKPLDQAEPNEILAAEVEIINLDLQDKSFAFDLQENPCGFLVAPPAGNVVPARGVETFVVDLQAPDQKFWYNYESCTISFMVYPEGQPGQFQTVILNVQMVGFYIDPAWVFWTVAIILAGAILFLIAKRRKERVEEEILGKPQKPWTIPAEKVYLEHLEEKDPRAAYVVRHYLMEDEYRSALAWYYAYKKATKGQRKKERLILRTEHAYETREEKWAKRIAEPMEKADRYERKLQRRLDKGTDRAHAQELKKHNALVEKLEGAHAKKAERETAKWEKAARRAEKKGEATPPKPDLGKPDLPPEPEPGPVALADHPWQKKADRYRNRMERKQARLEARYEKDHEKSLRKARRKAQRIARKLDDPDFVAEHPLLGGGKAESPSAAQD